MRISLLLSAALLLSIGTAIAQPVITENTHLPQAGNSYTCYSRTVAPIPGNSGANEHWNFTTLSASHTSQLDYLPCASVPNCGIVAGANLASTQFGTSLFYNAGVGMTQIVGEYEGNTLIRYSDPKEFTRFPMAFGTSYADSYKAQLETGTITLIRKGNINLRADAYGTLLLPAGTFTDVLRVHRIQNYSDRDLQGNINFNHVEESYTWYSAQHREPLLVISTHHTNGQLVGELLQYTGQMPLTVGQLNASRIQLGIYPNPAREAVTASFELDNNTDLSINLLDITGREVIAGETRSYTKGTNKQTLTTGHLPAGVYLLQLRSGQSTIHKKVEIL